MTADKQKERFEMQQAVLVWGSAVHLYTVIQVFQFNALSKSLMHLLSRMSEQRIKGIHLEKGVEDTQEKRS